MPDQFCESCEWWSYVYPDGHKKFGTCGNDFATESLRVIQDEASIDDPTVMTESNFGCIYHEGKAKNILFKIEIPPKNDPSHA